LDLIKRLRARDDGPKVLVLSMHDEALFAERSLRAGALGYVNKQEAPAKVVEALRQVLAGKGYLSPALTERLLRRGAGGGGAGGGGRRGGLAAAERVPVRPRGDGVPDDRPGAADAGHRRAAAPEHQDGRDLPRAHQVEAGAAEQRRAEPARGPVGAGEHLRAR